MPVALILAAFLLGSVPVGLVVARMKGVDIRSAGSGNIGATNVLRTVGKAEALVTLLGDGLKGFIPTAVAGRLLADPVIVGIVGLAAVLGHVFSVFLRFRGGKGVATALGMLLAYAPPAAIITIALWLAVFAAGRISSLGAIVSFALLPVTVLVVDPVRAKTWIAAALTLLIIARHKDNIRRLVRGEESRTKGKG